MTLDLTAIPDNAVVTISLPASDWKTLLNRAEPTEGAMVDGCDWPILHLRAWHQKAYRGHMVFGITHAQKHRPAWRAHRFPGVYETRAEAVAAGKKMADELGIPFIGG